METSFFLGRETLVPQPAFQAGQMAPRLVHLALALGLGHQDLLPHPAEPRYRTGQPDPDLDRVRAQADAARDARSAPRPAQHAPGLRAPDRDPVRTSRDMHRSRAVAPRHDRRDGRGGAGGGAADLRVGRLLDGRLRRLRGLAPGCRSGSERTGPDGHPGHARTRRRSTHASPRPSSSRRKLGRFHGVQRTLLPQLVHRRHIDDAADHPADPRHGPGDRRRRLRARAAGDHGSRRQPATAGRRSRCRPW